VLPAAFIGHGSPMNALELNRYTATWRAFGRAVPRPRAILVISAHWCINATAVTVMADPRTIHDFYGFPRELFAVRYPAPGLPNLVDEIAEAVKPVWVGADVDSWGIDHGAWSVLVHAFPDASVPVVQLSINAEKPLEYHYELGARMSELRRHGVLIVGSGNIVHNLRAVDFSLRNTGFDWAARFDDAAADLLTADPSRILTLCEHDDYAAAVPTPDHFIPMLYLAGLCAAQDAPADVLVDGYSYGALSMTSYTVGLPRADVQAGAADGRDAESRWPDVPADETNM